MEKKARLTYIDMTKGIAIILVVIGHSTVCPDNLLTWIASFHMPLFFIVAGLLFYVKKSQNETFKDYFNKRFLGIMIPYFIFSVYNILLFYFQSTRHPDIKTPEFIKDAYLQALSFYGISVLWFLPALFFGELLFFGIMKKLPKWAAVLAVLALAVIPSVARVYLEMVLPIDVAGTFPRYLRYFLYAILRVPAAASFIGIGYCAGFLKDAFCKKKGAVRGFAEVLAGIALLALNVYIAFKNDRVDMHYILEGNPVLFHLGAASATFGLLLICKHLPNLKLISHLGVNSLIVMVTHLDFQVVSIGLTFAGKVNRLFSADRGLLFYISLALFILVAELVIIYVMNRWFFFLLGKKHPVKNSSSDK